MDLEKTSQSSQPPPFQSTVVSQGPKHRKIHIVIFLAVVVVAAGLIYHFFIDDGLPSRANAEKEVRKTLALLESEDEVIFEEIKVACEKVPGKSFDGQPVACGYEGTKYWITKGSDKQFINHVVDKLVNQEMLLSECLRANDKSIECTKNWVDELARDNRHILFYKKDPRSDFSLSFDIRPPGRKKKPIRLLTAEVKTLWL